MLGWNKITCLKCVKVSGVCAIFSNWLFIIIFLHYYEVVENPLASKYLLSTYKDDKWSCLKGIPIPESNSSKLSGDIAGGNLSKR